nr:salivary glue protein Sgs-5 [Drosophila kikkawai]
MFSLKLLLVAAVLVGVARATFIIQPVPQKPVETSTNCKIYLRNLSWALEDCVCRCFQNECLMAERSAEREKAGQTPLVPVSEEVCKKFKQKKCLPGWPVVAYFPIPSPCGCNGKPGSLEIKKFKSLCLLNKYSMECSKPYISVSKC